MKKLSILIRVVAAIQIILGLFYLFAPEFILSSMGHSLPPKDLLYPLGMLAARFLAYGIAFVLIANQPLKNSLWIQTMIGIQLIDLAVGIFYTINGTVPLSLSGFPMFNAIWISLLLYWWNKKTGA